MRNLLKRVLVCLLSAGMVLSLGGVTALAAEVGEADSDCDCCTEKGSQTLSDTWTSDTPGNFHGDMEITSTDAEDGVITIAVGEEAEIAISPYAHTQYTGCDRTDCPDGCANDNCFTEMLGCSCNTEPLLRYADVDVEIEDESIVSAGEATADGDAEELELGEIMNGTVSLIGNSVGATTVTVTTTLRDWTSAEETYTVIVEDEEEGLPESEHPYAANTDESWSYTLEGATNGVYVTFDEQTETEEDWDFIYIYDGDGNLIGQYSGTELAGVTVYVPTAGFTIRLVSDDVYNDWGFAVTDVEAVGDTIDLGLAGSVDDPLEKVYVGDTPTADVQVGGTSLIQGTDFTVEADTSTAGRTVEVTITGIGSYSGELITHVFVYDEVYTEPFPESDHPYAVNTDDSWTYTLGGATDGVYVTFDERTSVEDGYDFIYIYDDEGNLVGEYTGTELAGATVYVPTAGFTIELASDGIITDWGFAVTDVVAASGTVDKSSLEEAIENAEALNEEDFTGDSWAVLEEALANAQEVLVNEDATQEDVDKACDELQMAIDNLEPAGEEGNVDKSRLEEAIETAETLNEEDYTEESWTVLQDALAAALAVEADENTTQEAVNDATVALVTAISNLQPVEEQPGETADKTDLENEFAEDMQLNQEDYTEESWAAFADALEKAQDILMKTDATQDEINEALLELQTSKDNLEPVEEQAGTVDKEVLEVAIEAAASLNKEDYTEESWAALEEALANARAVDEAENASEDAVKQATIDLMTAIADLEFEEKNGEEADKSDLLDEYVEGMKLNESDYTADSWAALQQALFDAQEVLVDPEATQDDVEAAEEALKTAMDNLKLVEPVDKEVLEAAIEAAANLNEEDYTTDSWAALEEALANAQAVDEVEKATEDAVKQATIDLVIAITELQLVEEPPVETADKTNLLNEYVEGMKLDASDYTPESWEPLADALADAQSVLTDPDATQDDVDAAEQALKTAMDNLVESGPVKNGLYRIEAGKLWGYYVDDVVDETYTGFASNENGDWWVVDGYVRFDVNSVEKDTLGKNGDKGVSDKGTWWYVVGNKVQHDFTGLANYKNANGWWYIVDGKVDFNHNGVDKNKNGWYYVMNGKVRFDFTGLANYRNDNGWWYISGGKVMFDHNGVEKNQNGWYYVKNSKVDFSFNGIASNKNGSWYITNGKVNFSYSGDVTYNGNRYTVKGGKVS